MFLYKTTYDSTELLDQFINRMALDAQNHHPEVLTLLRQVFCLNDNNKMAMIRLNGLKLVTGKLAKE